MTSPKTNHISETPLSPPPQPALLDTPPALIAFALSVIALCVVGFSIVYFCKCCCVNIMHTWTSQSSATGTLIRPSPNASSPFRGLDPSLLQAFPTFLYSTVKDLRKDKKKKYSLECAICLFEFEDDSMLRLLTVCCHVFHQECVDLWLHSHTTCPVCRTDLDLPTEGKQETRELEDVESGHVEEGRIDNVCIDVKECDGDKRYDDNHEDDGEVSVSVMQRDPKFVRSHSTGHSIVMIRGGDEGRNDDDDDDDVNDKYTLRLPEHVTMKIVRGGHNYSKSCSSYKDVARAPKPCSNFDHVQTLIGCSSSNIDTKIS
ncbi:hypothetical protein RJT34_06518 [Clitoria ternatea]|uniref:RING-type E3 ubiquitin transferase n=1 Tax=Clitoria ternatea TaxID=43366 RepID=A0AAN9PTL1_CLITE